LFYNRDKYNTKDGKKQVLFDISRRGKERQWRGFKKRNLKLAQSYERLGLANKANAVRDCGSSLWFDTCKKDGYKKLTAAHFCKVRLCPLCAWRRSMKIQNQATKIVEEALKECPDMEFILVTVSTRNCELEDTKESIRHMTASCTRLFGKKKRRKEIADAVIGYIRGTELTVNDKKYSDFYNTVNLHTHFLVAVPKEYFTSDLYISQERWVDLWKGAAKLDYEPIVDVRKIEAKRGQKYKAALIETLKYSVKSSGFLNDSISNSLMDERVMALTEGLHRARLFGTGGIFEEVEKRLNKEQKNNDSDLVVINGDKLNEKVCPICGGRLVKELYGWCHENKNYFKVGEFHEEYDNIDDDSLLADTG
jgi:plasmid rolling circle replication initiator protein Rep